MAHEVETMAYAVDVPWHGIGARVDQDVSVEEMLEAAGLNWDVNLLPLEARLPDGGTVPVNDRFALVRSTDHRVLTVTGKSWKPLQNSDTLGFMREYVEAGGATLETAGSLRQGKIVWGLARLNHNFEVTRGDRVNGYLLITSPHEVGRAINVRTTTVRVVCANTMALAMGQSDLNYKQNHLTEFDVAAAKAKVGEAHEHLLIAEQRAKTLQQLKISVEDAVRKVIIPQIIPEAAKVENIMEPGNQPKKLQELIHSINNAPGADRKTAWGVLNGVTYWADHVAGRDQAARMHRAWVGDTSRNKLDVEQALYELAA
jgi:phage/plasmid-like protein (TIGR03299 family)